jgi:hypothetical protein
VNPNSKRTNPRENPASGPAAASFNSSSRLRTMLIILVMAPKDPIYNNRTREDSLWQNEVPIDMTK